MTLQTSGPISIGDVAAEFGLTGQVRMSDLYGLGGAPSSGQLKLSDFYGLSNYPPFTAKTLTIDVQSGTAPIGGENQAGVKTYYDGGLDVPTYGAFIGSNLIGLTEVQRVYRLYANNLFYVTVNDLVPQDWFTYIEITGLADETGQRNEYPTATASSYSQFEGKTTWGFSISNGSYDLAHTNTYKSGNPNHWSGLSPDETVTLYP